MRLTTQAEILRHLNIQSRGGLSAPNNRFYIIPFNFSNVAANGKQTVSIKTNDTNDFVTDCMNGDLWLHAAGANPPLAIAGTPLPRRGDASPPATVGNQMPFLSQTEVSIKLNSGDWFMNPVRTHLLFGTAEAPFFPMFLPVLGAGLTCEMTLFNHSPAALSGQLAFIGHLVTPN